MDNSPFYHVENMLKKCKLHEIYYKKNDVSTGGMAVDDVIKDQEKLVLETMWRNDKKNINEKSGSLAHLFQLDKERELLKQNLNKKMEKQENDVVDQFFAEEELKINSTNKENPSKKYIIQMNSENNLKELASIESENDNMVDETVIKSIWNQKNIDTNTVWNTKDTEASSIWGNEDDVEELSLN